MARFAFVLALFVACVFCFSEAPAASTLRVVTSTETVEASKASEDLSETLEDLAKQLRTLADRLDALTNGDEKGAELFGTFLSNLLNGDLFGTLGNVLNAVPRAILDDLDVRPSSDALRRIRQALDAIAGIINGARLNLGIVGTNPKGILLVALQDIDNQLFSIFTAVGNDGAVRGSIRTFVAALHQAIGNAVTTVTNAANVNVNNARNILKSIEDAVGLLRNFANRLNNL